MGDEQRDPDRQALEGLMPIREEEPAIKVRG